MGWMDLTVLVRKVKEGGGKVKVISYTHSCIESAFGNVHFANGII